MIVQGREGPVEMRQVPALYEPYLKNLGQIHALDLSHREEEKKPVRLIGRSGL